MRAKGEGALKSGRALPKSHSDAPKDEGPRLKRKSRTTSKSPQRGQSPRRAEERMRADRGQSQRRPMTALICCCVAAPDKQLTDSGGPTGPGGGGSSNNNNNNINDGSQLEGSSGGTLTRSGSTRGSLRKVLPSVPDMDQQLTMATKMIDRRTSTPKGNHSYSPYFLEYTLLAEYNLLQKQRVSGVYVMPAANSPLVWLGVIFIRQGAYQEGIFRFNLHIPENYPDGDVPSVVFEVPVFHPLIDPETKELDVRRGFANKWRRNVNHLWHVLLYVRRSFYKIETSNPSNPEAAVLFDSDNELFQVRVRECVEASKNSVFDPPLTADPHAIVFSAYQPAIHNPILQELKRERNEADGAGKDGGLSMQGLSWVQPGTLHIFSKSSTSS